MPLSLGLVRVLVPPGPPTPTTNEEAKMSEERRAVHPQEPAEGEVEEVEAPGVDKAGDPANPETADGEADNARSVHPDEPAEGGGDEVEEPGADRPDNVA
jgi:hypothetical protein